MLIKTKKYQLPTGTFIKLAFKNIIREQWWVSLIYLALCACYFLAPSWWWIIGATILLILYLLFWLIQFAGVTQLEQGKVMFEKLSYEITSQQILIKINSKQGMPLKWESVKKAFMEKDAFVIFLGKAQLIYLPFKVFNSQNEVKFIETVLKRKGYLKE